MGIPSAIEVTDNQSFQVALKPNQGSLLEMNMQGHAELAEELDWHEEQNKRTTLLLIHYKYAS